MNFRDEWDHARMKRFAEEHGYTTPEQRLQALWDLVRWLDEQTSIPDDIGTAWVSGAFYRGERAMEIARVCNGVLVASSHPESVTPEQVEAEGARFVENLEAARVHFAEEETPTRPV